MFANYLRTAWRNLKKHKVFSVINILGLAIGMACCILITLWIADEIGFDRLQAAALDLSGRLLDGVHEGRFGGALFSGEEPVDVRGQVGEHGKRRIAATVVDVDDLPFGDQRIHHRR